MENKDVWIINHYAIAPSMGGLNRHYYFTKELKEKGYNVKIFTASTIHNTNINMISKDEKCKIKNVEVDGVDFTYIKEPDYQGNGLSRIFNLLGFMFDVPRIKGYCKGEKPDVIYTSTPDIFSTFASVLLAKRLKVPCVVEVRDLWPMSIVEFNDMSNYNPVIVILYQLEKWIYKKADALIFTMPGGKQYIQDKKWDKAVKLEKIFNINNGIDFEELNKAQQKEIEADEDLLNDKFKVVYAGSIRKANQVEKVIETAKVIQEKGDNDISFLIYGGGNQVEELQQKCVDEKINNVIFKGNVPKEHIQSILGKCNLGLLTYKNAKTWQYGGSQNKLFEYLACGLPVVTNINMRYSVIVENGCGIDAKDDPNSIAEAILEIKKMPKQEYENMKEKAVEVAKEYDYKILTEKLETVFDYAINSKKKK